MRYSLKEPSPPVKGLSRSSCPKKTLRKADSTKSAGPVFAFSAATSSDVSFAAWPIDTSHSTPLRWKRLMMGTLARERNSILSLQSIAFSTGMRDFNLPTMTSRSLVALCFSALSADTVALTYSPSSLSNWKALENSISDACRERRSSDVCEGRPMTWMSRSSSTSTSLPSSATATSSSSSSTSSSLELSSSLSSSSSSKSSIVTAPAASLRSSSKEVALTS
mmetsp:Transcript_7576/g.8261  ORF Transcript_7576/g.8261 Transcript_7576/m.8261 type:complete len:222 (+) Transcript_7576:1088-1753(+)